MRGTRDREMKEGKGGIREYVERYRRGIRIVKYKRIKKWEIGKTRIREINRIISKQTLND